jgi:hypothetical protein
LFLRGTDFAVPIKKTLVLEKSEHLTNMKSEGNMKSNGYIYCCPLQCPIKKHCFVIKLEKELTEPLSVLFKCNAQKGDIKINIGGEHPP